MENFLKRRYKIILVSMQIKFQSEDVYHGEKLSDTFANILAVTYSSKDISLQQ